MDGEKGNPAPEVCEDAKKDLERHLEKNPSDAKLIRAFEARLALKKTLERNGHLLKTMILMLVPTFIYFLSMYQLLVLVERKLFEIDDTIVGTLLNPNCTARQELLYGRDMSLYWTVSIACWEVFGLLIMYNRHVSKLVMVFRTLVRCGTVAGTYFGVVAALEAKSTAGKIFAAAAASYLGLQVSVTFLAIEKRQLRVFRRLTLMSILGICVQVVNSSYVFFAVSTTDAIQDVVVSGVFFPAFQMLIRRLFEENIMKGIIKAEKKRHGVVGVEQEGPQRRSKETWTLSSLHLLLEVMLSMPGFLVLYAIEDYSAFLVALALSLCFEIMGVFLFVKASTSRSTEFLDRILTSKAPSSAEDILGEDVKQEGDRRAYHKRCRLIAFRLASWELGERFVLVFAYVALSFRQPIHISRLLLALLFEFLADICKEQICAQAGIHLRKVLVPFTSLLLFGVANTALGATMCNIAGVAARCYY